MHLTCPECGARYSVDSALIPARGRDVECSDCGAVWFTAPPLTLIHPAPRPGAAAPPLDPFIHGVQHGAPPPDSDGERSGVGAGAGEDAWEAPPPAVPHRPIAESVRAILREEAEREARMRQERSSVAPDDRAEGVPAPRPNRSLPDSGRIADTLRGRAGSDPSGPPVAEARRSRFGTGFAAGLSIVALFAAAYLAAPAISREMPAARPILAAYVETVNAVRGRVDAALSGVAAELGMTAGVSDV